MAQGTKLEHRALGQGGLSVSAIGLGCMSLSGIYGAANDAESEDLIRYAIDQGVDHLRLDFELGIEAVEGVEYRQRVIARDVGGGPHRIERGEIGVWRERDGGGRLGPHDAQRGQRGRSGERGLQDITAFHAFAAPRRNYGDGSAAARGQQTAVRAFG